MRTLNFESRSDFLREPHFLPEAGCTNPALIRAFCEARQRANRQAVFKMQRLQMALRTFLLFRADFFLFEFKFESVR